MKGFCFMSKYWEPWGNAKQADVLTSPRSQQTRCVGTGKGRRVLQADLGDAGWMWRARALAGEAPPALRCLPLRPQLDKKASR